jgi:hypothetical protein
VGEQVAGEAVETGGELPGWISRHKARLVGTGIEVAGGKVCGLVGGEERYEGNPDTFVLDLLPRSWSRK